MTTFVMEKTRGISWGHLRMNAEIAINRKDWF